MCPTVDRGCSGCNVGIQLFPAWRQAWRTYEYSPGKKMNQDAASTAVASLHRQWLDNCGYDTMYDPDGRDPMADWEARSLGKTRKLGPNARKLYDVHSIRVSWGEWGPEHITVPGNACGLDICYGMGMSRRQGGKFLAPHNVDNLQPANSFASCIPLVC